MESALQRQKLAALQGGSAIEAGSIGLEQAWSRRLCNPCGLVSVRGKNAVEMHSPAKLSRGTEAAARFILSMERASPIPKKRIALALGE